MLKFCAMSLVRPKVPGLGPEVLGSGSSGGRGKSAGSLGIFGVNFLVSPKVPGVVEFIPGRTLNSRSENGGGKTRFSG